MTFGSLKAGAVLCAALTLSGCGNYLKPLDYHATQPYVPLTLSMVPPNTRNQEYRQREMTMALKETGAFSMLDGGFTQNGYSLLITEPNNGHPNYLGMLNILTLFTFPMPYQYKDNLRGTIFKDGQVLKTYNYSREGWSVLAWYVPLPDLENKRQMLDQLLREMDHDRLIPYQP